MQKVIDIITNTNFEVDFTKLRRMPARGELITYKDIMYEVVNYNSVFNEEGEPYIVILVKRK